MFEDKLKNNEETMAESESTKKKEFILGILFDAVECCLYSAFVWRVFRCYLGTDGSIFDENV
jgi:hypothetical protein